MADWVDRTLASIFKRRKKKNHKERQNDIYSTASVRTHIGDLTTSDTVNPRIVPNIVPIN